MNELIMLGCMEGNFEIINRVYSTDGIAPTINTCGGGQRAKNYGRTNSKDKTGHKKRIYRM
jgi:hypothetical protein